MRENYQEPHQLDTAETHREYLMMGWLVLAVFLSGVLMILVGVLMLLRNN